ncbi:MAG: AbrB family transcriptional regulator [Chloroflexi bacterium]|nr:AbrB family transcriptional regulator [Chloroflexota bacterium]
MHCSHRIDQLSRGVLLLTIGAVGGLGATALDIPAGMIIGALLASGVYRLAGGDPGGWRQPLGFVGRLILGAYIGASFGPDVIDPLKSAILPMTVLITAMVAAGLGLGWALCRTPGVNLPTGLLSSLPGGLPAMAAVADELDADATVVATIHFFRLLSILLLVPVLVPLLIAQSDSAAALRETVAPVGIPTTVAALGMACVGGWLANRARIPTGDLIGGIVTVAGLNLAGLSLGPLHPGLREVAMLLTGVAIGTELSRDSLHTLRRVVLNAAVNIVAMLTLGLLLGWLLYLTTPLDLATALLSAVPGGAATMPVIAHHLGGDIRLVAALHLTRQIVIFIILPPVLSLILRRSRYAPSSVPQREVTG